MRAILIGRGDHGGTVLLPACLTAIALSAANPPIRYYNPEVNAGGP